MLALPLFKPKHVISENDVLVENKLQLIRLRETLSSGANV